MPTSPVMRGAQRKRRRVVSRLFRRGNLRSVRAQTSIQSQRTRRVSPHAHAMSNASCVASRSVAMRAPSRTTCRAPGMRCRDSLRRAQRLETRCDFTNRSSDVDGRSRQPRHETCWAIVSAWSTRTHMHSRASSRRVSGFLPSAKTLLRVIAGDEPRRLSLAMQLPETLLLAPEARWGGEKTHPSRPTRLSSSNGCDHQAARRRR